MPSQDKQRSEASQARDSERPIRHRRSATWAPNFGADFFKYKEVVDHLLTKPGLTGKQIEFLHSIRFARQMLSMAQLHYLLSIQNRVYR